MKLHHLSLCWSEALSSRLPIVIAHRVDTMSKSLGENKAYRTIV